MKQDEKNTSIEESIIEIKEPIVIIKRESSLYAQILQEHGGLESNIPVGSNYWRIRP